MSKGKEPNDLVKQMSKNLWIYNLQEDGNIGVFLLWDLHQRGRKHWYCLQKRRPGISVEITRNRYKQYAEIKLSVKRSSGKMIR